MDYILEARNLKKTFSLDAGFFARNDRKVYAVNDVSFGIERGGTYGLVGESGCGKTTTARILVGMYKADSGEIRFGSGSDADARPMRERIKYVFQDPSRSLNPRMTVGSILTEAYRYSSIFPGKEKAREEAGRLLEEVGLDSSDLDRLPSEFSGGQRQRISIARGLIMKPDVLICDEIVSALDVSVQGQILNLLLDLKKSRDLSFLFIAHDLRVSCYFCDTIGVMYSGVLVEEAPAADLYKTATHPYTKLLFAGSQGLSGGQSGEVKTALKSVSGCPFAHRCPHAVDKCLSSLPEWKIVSGNHKVRCWL
jgi:oligopeptide/dipeptide ABC transporter ATP-binding protein